MKWSRFSKDEYSLEQKKCWTQIHAKRRDHRSFFVVKNSKGRPNFWVLLYFINSFLKFFEGVFFNPYLTPSYPPLSASVMLEKTEELKSGFRWFNVGRGSWKKRTKSEHGLNMKQVLFWRLQLVFIYFNVIKIYNKY